MGAALGFGAGLPYLGGAGGPAMSLNFIAMAAQQALSPLVTFSRGTNATMFDSQGRLCWAPVNLCSRSNNMTAGWSLYAEGTSTLLPGALPSGRDATRFETTAASPTGLTSITAQAAVAGSFHALTVKVRYVNHPWIRVGFYSGSVSTNQARMWFNLQTGTLGAVQVSGAASGATADTPINLGGGWYQLTIRANVPFSAATDAGLLIATATADGSTTRAGAPASFDAGDVLFEPVGAQTPQAFTAAHVTAGAPYYGPRFDRNPATLESLGILVEETRSNLSPIIGAFGQTGYSFGGLASAPTAGSTKLGWQSHRFTADGLSAQHFCSGGVTAVAPAASTVHTASGYIFGSSQDLVQITVSSGFAAADVYANFRLSTLSVTAQGAGATAASITQVIPGVWRVTMTFTTFAGTATGAACILALISSATDTRLPAFVSSGWIEAFGYQLEAGAFATSLIPTFGAAATRNLDALSTATSGWYQSAGGTLVAVGTIPANAAARTLCNLQGSGLNERNQLRMSAGGNFSNVVTVGGVVQAGSISFAGAAGRRKMAYQFANGSQQLSVDGAAPVSGTAAAIPTAVTSLIIGSLITTGSEMLNGWIESVSFYPRADFSNAQLQALSA